MKIALGSTSTDKINILKKALDGQVAYTEIIPTQVDSGIAEQPLSQEETMQGAINRAKNALALQTQASIAVGLETGLEDVGGIYNLVCAAAFWDGQQLITGQSGRLPLPLSVSDQIKQGGQFGQLIQAYQPIATPDEQERIKQLISRESSFISAINKAMPQVRQRHGNNLLVGISSILKYWGNPVIELHNAIGLFRFAAISLLVGAGGRVILALFTLAIMFVSGASPLLFSGFFGLIHLLLIVAAAAWTVGVLRLPKLLRHYNSKSITHAARLAAIWSALFTVLLISTIGSLFIGMAYPTSTIGNLTSNTEAIFIPVLIVVTFFTVRTTWSLLTHINQNAAIPEYIKVSIAVGQAAIAFNLWIFTFAPIPQLPLAIFIASQLLWSLGVWNLAQELENNLNPSPVSYNTSGVLDRG